MDIGMGCVLTRAELSEALTAILKGCAVHVVDEGGDLNTIPFGPGVLVYFSKTAFEFPTGITVCADLNAGVSNEAWLRELARCLVEQLQTRTIFDGTPFGDSDAPFWSLIWDHGVPYLADDAETDCDDGEGGPVRIVRALPLTLFLPRLDLAASVTRKE